MPSEYSPADSAERERFPGLEADIDEDLARWLDRDLFDHGQARLQGRDNAGYNEGRQRVVRDSEVSASGELIRDRITGIDELAVARARVAIERRLERTPEGDRDVVRVVGPVREGVHSRWSITSSLFVMATRFSCEAMLYRGWIVTPSAGLALNRLLKVPTSQTDYCHRYLRDNPSMSSISASTVFRIAPIMSILAPR